MKVGSFTQIYIQLVICVKYKDRMLSRLIRKKIFKIMGGILNEYGHRPIIINGVEDHLHIFYSHNPNVSLSNTVKELKRRTSLYINNQQLFDKRFRWETGYGAFSYSKSHMERVYNYIERQEQHHLTKSFKKEYITLLKRYGIAHDPKHLPDF